MFGPHAARAYCSGFLLLDLAEVWADEMRLAFKVPQRDPDIPYGDLSAFLRNQELLLTRFL